MAILNDLLVKGCSRFLQQIYVNDDMSISGTLVLSKTQDAAGTADNGPALIVGGTRTAAHLELDNNELMAKGSGTTTADLYINTDGGNVYLAKSGATTQIQGLLKVQGNSTFTGAATFNGNLTANGTTALKNVSISSDLTVANNLTVEKTLIVEEEIRSPKWIIDNIANLGGEFVIAPTIVCGTGVSVTVAGPSSNQYTITVTDSSITSTSFGGISWRNGSIVKVSGTINGVVFVSVNGTMSQALNTTTNTIQFKVSSNDIALTAGTYTGDKVKNLHIMMYKVGGTIPVGIFMTSYGANKYPYIEIYSGTDTNTLTTRLGYLDGLPAIVNNISPSGWGLYTNNGFFSGTIVSTSGQIGGWTLGTSAIYHGTLGATNGYMLNASGNSSTSINGTSRSNLTLAIGSKFAVGNDGTLYANGANVTNINANNISTGSISADCIKANVISAVNNGTGTIDANKINVSAIKIGDLNGASDYSTTSETNAAILANGIEYIAGTQTAATNVWTGVTKETALVAGKTIAYHLPFAGTSTAATLTLTLANGSTTAAVSVKFNTNNSAANNVTTHFGAGSVINMTYDGTYWRVAAGYYDTGGITNALYRTRNPNAIKAVAACTSGHIICGTSSGYRDLAANVSFDLTYALMYCGTSIAANATGTNNYLTYNGVNAKTSGTVESITQYSTVYLKGTVDGKTFKISASPFLTCKVPTSDDGFAYIPLGVTYNTTPNIYFNSSSDVYAFRNGAFQKLDSVAKYITAITDAGIRVHAKSNPTTNYAAIDADGMDVVKGSVSVAKFGETARIGKEAGYHTEVTSTGMNIKNGSTLTSHFGTEAEFYDGNGNKLATVGTYTDQFREGKLDFGSDLGFVSGRRDLVAVNNALLLHAERWLTTEGRYQHIHASGTDTETYGNSTDNATVIMEATRRNGGGDDEDVYYYVANIEAHVADDEEIESGWPYAEVHISTGRAYDSSGIGGNGTGMWLRDEKGNDESHVSTLAVRADRIRLVNDNASGELEGVEVYPTHGVVNWGQGTGTPANSYKDFTVDFGHVYSATPHVIVGFYSTSTAPALGGLSCAVNSITTTGCTIRIFNNTSTARSPAVEWIAIG